MDKKGTTRMKKLSVPILAASMAAGLFWASAARASFVPWTYNWGRSPIAIQANAPGTGGISLTDEATHEASGSSDVVATNLRTFSAATRTSPDRFTDKVYTLNLFLKDSDSGESATLSFNGKFDGTLTASNANITNTFTGDTTKTVHLGSHDYTVTVGSYAPPGPPAAANAGSITAHVGVDEPVDPPPLGGGTGSLPEPSTLILSCLGLSCLGLRSSRKWLRQGQA
jgi:hypothetical protein